MSELKRGRVLRASDVTDTATVVPIPPRATTAVGRRIPSEVARAHDEARGILERAQRKADGIAASAAAAAKEQRTLAEEAGRAEGSAALAAAWLTLHAREESAAVRELSRTVDLAVLLAERVVGNAVSFDSKLIVPVAERALREARGARAVVLEAHPLDVATLREHVGLLGVPEGGAEFKANESLARGDLLFHTDLGTLDARLRTQLERLATALRDAR